MTYHSMLLLLATLVACGGGGGSSPAPLDFETFQPAAVILGQFDGQMRGANASDPSTNASGVSNPFGGPARGGDFLYLPDQGNRRLLGFPVGANLDGTAASFVVGQTDLTSNESATSASRFTPVDCWIDDGRLFVVDIDAHRILIWNALPQGDVPADIVIGQTDFTASDPGTSSTRMSSPTRVRTAGGKMVVADFANNRVLIWNTIPVANHAPADVVVGQLDFSSTANVLNNFQFAQPRALWADGRRLVVGDTRNSRVLIWDTMPTTNGQPADRVVGQPDFTSLGFGTGPDRFDGPFGVCVDNDFLYVADTRNHRVLLFEYPPENGANAFRVIGQADFNANTANDDDQDTVEDATASRRVFRNPISVDRIGRRLYITDQSNHRVLAFDG